MLKFYVSPVLFYKIRPTFLKNFFQIDPSFSELGIPQGNVSRKTFAGRLIKLDHLVIDYCLPKFSSNNGVFNFLDLGCSTGVTSLDSYNFFKNRDLSFNIYINDPFSFISIYRIKYLLSIYKSSVNGSIISFKLFNFIACVYNRKFFLSFMLYALLKYFSFNIPFYKSVNFLVSDVNLLLQSGDLFSVNNDFFDKPSSERFDIIRVANLLNSDLFSLEKSVEFMSNVFLSLNDNGFLLVARESNVTNYTLFRKVFLSECNAFKLVIVTRSLSGCDMEELWLNT